MARANPWQATEAQREARDAEKRRMWGAREFRLMALPPPSPAEADALVAAYLARGGAVTRCPAAAVAIPNNAGMPWRHAGGNDIGAGWVQARRV